MIIDSIRLTIYAKKNKLSYDFFLQVLRPRLSFSRVPLLDRLPFLLLLGELLLELRPDTLPFTLVVKTFRRLYGMLTVGLLLVEVLETVEFHLVAVSKPVIVGLLVVQLFLKEGRALGVVLGLLVHLSPEQLLLLRVLPLKRHDHLCGVRVAHLGDLDDGSRFLFGLVVIVVSVFASFRLLLKSAAMLSLVGVEVGHPLHDLVRRHPRVEQILHVSVLISGKPVEFAMTLKLNKQGEEGERLKGIITHYVSCMWKKAGREKKKKKKLINTTFTLTEFRPVWVVSKCCRACDLPPLYCCAVPSEGRMMIAQTSAKNTYEIFIIFLK